MIIGMVLFPRLTLLDLAGPYEVFARIPDARVRLAAATLDPVRTDQGMEVLPDTPFEDAPQFDVLFVPGGPGQYYRMEDRVFLDFLRKQAQEAQWITSVCTGALLLGAAGLLRGYQATTHWMSMDLLELLGAKPVPERVVVDRNRITGAGVTAGIDVALVIAARTGSDDLAREIQLNIEYDPHPPFHSGSPRTAEPALVERVAESRRAFQDKVRVPDLRLSLKQREKLVCFQMTDVDNLGHQGTASPFPRFCRDRNGGNARRQRIRKPNSVEPAPHARQSIPQNGRLRRPRVLIPGGGGDGPLFRLVMVPATSRSLPAFRV